jgi:glycerol uptake facilitator-like aquaporin
MPEADRATHRVVVAPLARRLLAEFLGAGLLVAVVIGSGIAAQQLSPTDTDVQLLQNSLTTVFGLGVLILLFGPVSGAHFNPVVSAVDWAVGRRTGTGLTGTDLATYTTAQILGGVGGALPANIMFGLTAVQIAHHVRAGARAVGRRNRRHRWTDRPHPHLGPHRPCESVQRHLRGHRPRVRTAVRRLSVPRRRPGCGLGPAALPRTRYRRR